MKKIILILSLCSLLLVTGCTNTPKLKDGKEIVAEINDYQVTAEELYAAMKTKDGVSILLDQIDTFIAKKEITDEEGAKKYADAQLAMIKSSYEQQGQDFAKALRQAGFATEQAYKDILIINYKKNKVLENYIKTTFTNDEIEKYYKDEVVGEQTVRHILIIPNTTDTMTTAEKTAAETKALEEAKALIKKLDEGTDFATLAKEKSEDTGTATNGGLFANFTAEGVDEAFFKASKALKANEYTKEPVKSQFGYHIILKVSEKEKEPLEDVKDFVIDSLLSDELTDINADTTGKKFNQAWAKIRENYKLNIVDTSIKNIYEATIED